jgi:hypothetical protein
MFGDVRALCPLVRVLIVVTLVSLSFDLVFVTLVILMVNFMYFEV